MSRVLVCVCHFAPIALYTLVGVFFEYIIIIIIIISNSRSIGYGDKANFSYWYDNIIYMYVQWLYVLAAISVNRQALPNGK